jgi:hypothetical protein
MPWYGLIMGLLTTIPEEVIEVRRFDDLSRFTDFILNKLRRMKGAGPYLHFLGGPRRN